jgi:hypothetical protein
MKIAYHHAEPLTGAERFAVSLRSQWQHLNGSLNLMRILLSLLTIEKQARHMDKQGSGPWFYRLFPAPTVQVRYATQDPRVVACPLLRLVI